MKTTCPILLGPLALLAGLLLGPTPPAAAQEKKKDTPVRVEAGGRSSLLVRKLIVESSEARLHQEIGDKGTEAEPFAIYFQLYAEDGKEEKGGHYRVGTSTGKVLGWVKKEHVLAWDTRFLLYPHVPKGDAVFQVFDKKNPADKDPGTDADLVEAKMELKAALNKYPAKALVMAPILAKPASEKDSAYRIAYFVGKARVAGAPVVRERDDIRDLKLEVVFAIDTTLSMQPLIDGCKEVVGEVAKQIAGKPELKGKVRLGLVEYQDLVPGLKPANMVSKLTDDLDAFQKALKPLKQATTGSEDSPEDVLAGLKMAIEESGWERNSSKHIILVGDASAQLGDMNRKNTTKLTIKQVLALGRAKGGSESEKQRSAITFHSVLAKSVDPVDFKVAQAHFREVSQNNGEVEGEYQLLERPDDKTERDKVVKTLVDRLSAGATALAQVTSAARAPDSPLPEVAKGPIAEGVYRIFKTSSGEAKKDVHSGWAAERNAKGNQVALKRVLITEVELKRLESTLKYMYDQLATRVEPEERKDVAGLLTIFQAAAASTGAGQTVAADKNLQELIARDLPLKTDVLRITAKDLAGYNKRVFEDWLKKLKETHAYTVHLIRTSEWSETKLGGKAVDKYAFLLVAELP
jgi:hypothetical protein